MSRLFIFVLLASLVISAQFLANCSSPLETTEKIDNPIDPNPPGGRDTIFLIDTLTFFDTVFTGDTVYSVDTIFNIDTIIVVDSLGGIDTIFLTDTITFVDTTFWVDTVNWTDTVIIVDTIMVPDTSGSPVMCAQLSSARQEIIWVFSNPSGLFDLTFVATTERDKPTTILTVEIDGDLFQWDLSENLVFNIDRELVEPTTEVRITTNKPPARGHAVNLCLTVIEQ